MPKTDMKQRNSGEQHIIDIIRRSGLRATPQRIALLKLLRNTKSHPTAEALMQMANHKGFNLSMGTIYNTLDSFEKKGLISRVHGSSDVMRYDAETDFHVHLVNQSTEEIVDLFDDELEELIRQRLKAKFPDGFNPQKLEVTIYQ
jgi:Fur family peroxide stress response transcriptional regulator